MYGSKVLLILVILHLRHFYEIWPSILHSAHALEQRPIKLSARGRNGRHDKAAKSKTCNTSTHHKNDLFLQLVLYKYFSGVDLIWKHEIDTMLPNVKPETCQHRNTQRGKGKTENVIWLQSCVCRFLFELRAMNSSPKEPTPHSSQIRSY